MVDVATVVLTAKSGDLVKAKTHADGLTASTKKTEVAAKSAGDAISRMGTRSATDIKKAEDAQKRLNTTMEQAARIAKTVEAAERARARTLDQFGVQARNAGSGMTVLAANARGASYQVSDMAVQLSMGTNAFIVMGQQLPQLIAGLQLGGAAAGGMAMAMNLWLPIGAAVLAVAAPIAMAFMNSADSSKALDEAMSALAETTEAYLASSQLVRTSVDELAKTYGTLADEVLRANQAQAGQDLMNQMSAQATAAQALLDTLTETEVRFSSNTQNGKALSETYRVLADDMGLSDEKAQALISSLEGLASARGPDQIAQAALQVQAALDGARDSAGQLPPPLAEAYGQLTEMITAAGQVKGEIEQYPGILGAGASAAGVMAGQVSGIGAAAQSAAAKLWAMAGAMGAAYAGVGTPGNLARQGEDGRGGQRDSRRSAAEFNTNQTLAGLNISGGVLRAPSGGGSGGGGGSSAASEAEKEAAAIQKVNEALQNQIDMIGLSDEARRVQQEIQKAGVDLNSAEGQAIEALVVKLTQLEEAHKRAAEIGKALAQGLEDIFVAALSGADAAREAASKLLMELGRMLIHQAFQQLTKGLIGGGGFLGGLFGARAEGGPVEAGKPYLVNENTANSEVFVPSRSGAILNVPQAQKALAGQMGSQRAAAPVVNVAPAQVVVLDDPAKYDRWARSSQGEEAWKYHRARSGG